jgi:threonine dehydrogenase-like Zn-dependent dehydrogenase
VLLRVGAVSVCGSDVHQAYNTHSWAVNVPVVLGHEFSGTIAKAGRAVKRFREGDRVVSETAAEVCGECLLCRTGRYNLCPLRKGFGYGIDGAMASFVKVPARCLHRIPDTLPFELACLVEPHAVAYNAMCVNSTIRPGDLVVVLGPGPIGLLCARMAALAGADPLVVVGPDERRAAARNGDAARVRRASSMPSGNRSRRSSADSSPSAPISCATHPAQAGRSTWRWRSRDRMGRSRKSAGRRTWCPSTSTHSSRRTSGCRDRSATTIRCGNA